MIVGIDPGPGRPSSKTPEICAEICERLSTGETLSSICRDDKMPQSRTVYDWLDADKEFSANFARGRIVGFDAIADRTKEIARGTSPESSGDVQRDKLIVETDLKLLAKWDPKRYGDRQVLAGDSAAPLQVQHELSFAGLDPAARAALKMVLESVALRDGGEPDKA